MTPLSIDPTEQQQQQQHEEEEEDFDLDERILSIVKACPNQVIRPSKLSATLGISIDDASAELCGLLKAVGKGSSFTFDDEKVMVFQFPPDFERKARRFRRRQTMQQAVRRILLFSVKCIKIVTAFGLILSLLIVSVAAMVGLVAAIIAMSRSGHGGAGHHRAELVRRLHSMFYTMRQLLWCYAMFGGNFGNQDPFLQEIAYDLALFSSMCCGNPGSLFFWMRATQLSRRRRRRGWASLDRNNTDNMEGVALVQRETWGRNEDEPPAGTDQEEAYRGLLSVSVEFLFGPSPFSPGPTESEKWKLRGAVIVERSSESAGKGVSLDELSPYIDSPPAALSHEIDIVSEGLTIVSHFNGRPVSPSDDLAEPISASKARFVFPELLSESSTVIKYEEAPDPDDGSWEYLCYAGDAAFVSVRTASGRISELPSSLQEQRYVLTKLEKKQFQQCVILGILNFVGVKWLRQSLEPGGVLDISSMAGSYVAAFLQRGLMPVLYFYSILFFVLPFGRLLLIVVLNFIRERRSRRRADFAHALKTSSQV